jgi:two-component system cell cycle sensor histidine kinase/response regulator CckA
MSMAHIPRTSTAAAAHFCGTDRPALDVEILLVTPDEDLRAVGERVLEREGYKVRVGAHAGHAVLAAMTGRVDVLVTELSAPDMSGPALTELLRRRHPQVRVIYMAKPGTPEGLEHVIVRPFTRDDLLGRIAATSPSAS